MRCQGGIRLEDPQPFRSCKRRSIHMWHELADLSCCVYVRALCIRSQGAEKGSRSAIFLEGQRLLNGPGTHLGDPKA